MLSNVIESLRESDAREALEIGFVFNEADDMRMDQDLAYAEEAICEDNALYEHTEEDEAELQEVMEALDDFPDTTDEEIQRILDHPEGLSFEDVVCPDYDGE